MLSSLGASDAKLCNFLCVSVQPAQKNKVAASESAGGGFGKKRRK
jgi:hypothetical protein